MSHRVVVFTGRGLVEVRSEPTVSLKDGEAMVRVHYSGVSSGTEMRCLAGEQPDTLEFPFIPGYSHVGVVEQGPKEWVGRRVFTGGTKRSEFGTQWGGHSEVGICPVGDLILLPEEVNLEEAALLQMAGIGYRGVQHVKEYDVRSVLVVGLGLIGMLSALLYRAEGYQVTAVDIDPGRVELAKAKGIDAKVKADGLFDVVVDATGSLPVLAQSIRHLKDVGWSDHTERPGVLVLQGSYAQDVVFNYQEAFRKEMTLVMPRHTQPQDKLAVLELLKNGKVDLSGLALTCAVDEAPAVYRKKVDRSFEGLTAVFAW